MKNEKIVHALDSIAPDESAKRRMLENIKRQAGFEGEETAADVKPVSAVPANPAAVSAPVPRGETKPFDSSAFTPIPEASFPEAPFEEVLIPSEDLPDLPHASVDEPVTYRHEERKQQMSRPWAIGIGIAACLVLAAGVGALTIPHFLGAGSSDNRSASVSMENSAAVTGNAAESASSGEDSAPSIDQGATAGPDQTYSELSWNDTVYAAGVQSSDQSDAARLDPTEVGDSLGTSTAASLDGDTQDVEVFAMVGIDPAAAVAVRFPSDTAYYLYTAPVSEIS